MTRQRATKGPFGASSLAAALAIALGVGIVAVDEQARAEDNLFAPGDARHLIADPRTGLAIYGYDPVAFHVDGAALPGSPLHELALDGVIWRFRSAANKAAFEQTPAVYLPLFGGHDAAGVAAGVMSKGDPELFAVIGGRLAFFRDQAGRDRFAGEPAFRAEALRAWPAVVRLQAGH